MYDPLILKEIDGHVVPPTEFLDTLIETVCGMTDSIFAPNAELNDVYSEVSKELPFTKDILTRKAYMCMILLALLAFESDYKWEEGADTTAGPEKPDEVETGIAQVSANSMNFGDLREFAATVGIKTTEDFIRLMKIKHSFAIQYIIRLLRITYKANGPIVHKLINGWLDLNVVNALKVCLNPPVSSNS